MTLERKSMLNPEPQEDGLSKDDFDLDIAGVDSETAIRAKITRLVGAMMDKKTGKMTVKALARHTGFTEHMIRILLTDEAFNSTLHEVMELQTIGAFGIGIQRMRELLDHERPEIAFKAFDRISKGFDLLVNGISKKQAGNSDRAGLEKMLEKVQKITPTQITVTDETDRRKHSSPSAKAS